MARISGMIFGIALLIVISSLASPAGAWDSDDDDGHRRGGFRFDGDDDDDFRRRGFHFDRDDDDDFGFHKHRHHRRYDPFYAPLYRQELFYPRRPLYRGYPDTYNPPVPQQRYYAPPQQQNYYPPIQEQPIAPEPLPPEALGQGGYQPQPELAAPPVAGPLHERPGQFVDAGVPLYPHVRVKGADEAPAFGVHRILAVRNPDPRIPGCAYVRVFVPPGPCKKVKVDDGGAKIELNYDDFEVKVESERGVITVEYDD